MNGVVVAYIIGALIGISIVLLVAEAIPYWRDASKRIDAGVAYLQGLPRKDEEEE
jgi:hypothetical protein